MARPQSGGGGGLAAVLALLGINPSYGGEVAKQPTGLAAGSPIRSRPLYAWDRV
jgi:hypothetical protein